MDETEQGFYSRRLSCAVSADESGYLTLFEREADIEGESGIIFLQSGNFESVHFSASSGARR